MNKYNEEHKEMEKKVADESIGCSKLVSHGVKYVSLKKCQVSGLKEAGGGGRDPLLQDPWPYLNTYYCTRHLQNIIQVVCNTYCTSQTRQEPRITKR